MQVREARGNLEGAGRFSSTPAISVNRNHAVRAPFAWWTSTVPQLVLLQLFTTEQLHPSLLTLNAATLCEKKHPAWWLSSSLDSTCLWAELVCAL